MGTVPEKAEHCFALMISFGMEMADVLGQRASKRRLTEENQLPKTFLFH